MKTTMMFRNIANPRRTTLAHLEDLQDAEGARTPEQSEQPVEHAELPAQTANPRRTILMDVPVATTITE
ncbi:hypothetical protein ACLVWQ_25200 [Streptomyces sp. CWNU-52B]|uniref:hypothetical protein n=1 Tax=unclassified Streptomyces TaxID=2593676 RepID=UPI0039C1C8D9